MLIKSENDNKEKKNLQVASLIDVIACNLLIKNNYFVTKEDLEKVFEFFCTITCMNLF